MDEDPDVKLYEINNKIPYLNIFVWIEFLTKLKISIHVTPHITINHNCMIPNSKK